MVRRVGVIAAVAVATALLAGCTPKNQQVAALDRPVTEGDTLPAGVVVEIDPATSRYVGTDSDGDRYWVARPMDSTSSAMCIVYQPAAAGAGGDVVFCGTLPLSSTTVTGKTVEFEVAPVTLSATRAEIIGDTLLVSDATPIVSG